MSLDCFQAVANSLVPDHFLETSTEREREREGEREGAVILLPLFLSLLVQKVSTFWNVGGSP